MALKNALVMFYCHVTNRCKRPICTTCSDLCAPNFVSQSGHPVLVKKKRGRPKGSKNKPKDGSLAKSSACAEGSDDDSDRLGGARLPIVDVMPRISKEKAAMYSIILSDINQKMLSQSSMNLMLSWGHNKYELVWQVWRIPIRTCYGDDFAHSEWIRNNRDGFVEMPEICRFSFLFPSKGVNGVFTPTDIFSMFESRSSVYRGQDFRWRSSPWCAYTAPSSWIERLNSRRSRCVCRWLVNTFDADSVQSFQMPSLNLPAISFVCWKLYSSWLACFPQNRCRTVTWQGTMVELSTPVINSYISFCRNSS